MREIRSEIEMRVTKRWTQPHCCPQQGSVFHRCRSTVVAPVVALVVAAVFAVVVVVVGRVVVAAVAAAVAAAAVAATLC